MARPLLLASTVLALTAGAAVAQQSSAPLITTASSGMVAPVAVSPEGEVAISGSTGAWPASPAPLCGPPADETLAVNRYVRVHFDVDADTPYSLPGASACVPGAQPSRLDLVLGKHAISLRGRRLAFARLEDPFNDEGGQGVRIISGRVPGDFIFAPAVLAIPRDDAVASATTAVVRVRLTRSGAVAWSACPMSLSDYTSCQPGAPVRIYAANRAAFNLQGREREVRLGQGLRIDPDSLRISPSERRFAWNDGRTTRTAPVPR